MYKLIGTQVRAVSANERLENALTSQMTSDGTSELVRRRRVVHHGSVPDFVPPQTGCSPGASVVV